MWYSLLLKCFSQDAPIFECFPLDLSCFGSIIITNGREIKISISISRSLATVAGREAIQEMSPLMHAILIKQVRFRKEGSTRGKPEE